MTAPENWQPARELIIWNVGQGLWTTYRDEHDCFHFDAGGERAPWRAIKEACQHQQNYFSFSHWDADHVSFAGPAQRHLNNACLLKSPRGAPATARKRREAIEHMRACGRASPSAENYAELYAENPRRPQNKNARATNRNDDSRVFLIANTLIPGDSVKSAERIWAPRLPSSVRTLVLGHHGSRTSTSEELLRFLPNAHQAIASARFKKYGHPHREVAERLRAHGVALVRTEDWGTLRFILTACKGGTPCSSSSRPARK